MEDLGSEHVQVLHIFFLETVEDAATSTQRAARQAARTREVRRSLRRALSLLRRDASEASDDVSSGFGGIVLSSCSLQKGRGQFSARGARRKIWEGKH